MASVYTWSRLDVPHGLGQARFVHDDDGILVTGAEVDAGPEGRWSATFWVDLDAQWRTRAADLGVADADGERRRRLETDGYGIWAVDGEPAPHLDGCLDIDVGAVPFTNTFVINRTGLEVGECVDLVVAFVDVPSLEVQALPQRYRRVSADRWTYGDDAFGTYDIQVDADGIVVDYSDFAKRV